MAQPGAAPDPLSALLGALKIDRDAWDKIDPTSAREANSKQALERYERARIIAAGVSDDALAVMREMTIEAVSFDVAGLGLPNAIGMGIMREGQNSIVRWIEQQKRIAAQGPGGDIPAASRPRRSRSRP